MDIIKQKQIKTAEEVLSYYLGYDCRKSNECLYLVSAMQEYTKQFIDAAAEELDGAVTRSEVKESILKLKELVK